MRATRGWRWRGCVRAALCRRTGNATTMAAGLAHRQGGGAVGTKDTALRAALRAARERYRGLKAALLADRSGQHQRSAGEGVLGPAPLAERHQLPHPRRADQASEAASFFRPLRHHRTPSSDAHVSSRLLRAGIIEIVSILLFQHPYFFNFLPAGCGKKEFPLFHGRLPHSYPARRPSGRPGKSAPTRGSHPALPRGPAGALP